MNDSEKHGRTKSQGSVRSRRQLLVVAVVLVVAIAWVASLLLGRSTPTASPTAAPTSSAQPPQVRPGVIVTTTVMVTATATVTPTVTVTKTVQTSPMGVMGPTGVGKIQLGMTYKAAVATGQVVKASQGGWAIKDHPSAEVCMSKANGVMAIFADKSAVSPEGIHLGSTMAQVKAAYPNLTATPNGYFVSLTATTSYGFLFGGKKGAAVATEWFLQSSNETCFD